MILQGWIDRRALKRAVGGLCIPCVLLLSLPAIAATGPVKLRYRLHTGDQFVYSVVASGEAAIQASQGGSIPPGRFTMRVRQQRTVVAAHPDGTFTIADRMLDGGVTVAMQGVTRTIPMQPRPATFSTINALGRMTLGAAVRARFQSAGSPYGVDPSALIDSFSMLGALPMEPVHAGSRWTRRAGFSLPRTVSIAIVLDNRLARMTQVAGVSTAEVVTAVRVPAHIDVDQSGRRLKVDGNAEGMLQTNYSLATGMPVRATARLRGRVGIDTNSGAVLSTSGPTSGHVDFTLQFQARMVSARRGAAVPSPEEIAAAPAARSLVTAPPAPVESQASDGAAAGPAAATLAPIELRVPTRRGMVRGDVPIQAVLAEDKPVGYVAFLVNGRREYITNTQPFRYDWDTSSLPAGPYVLGLELYGANGELLYETPRRRVRVQPG